MGIMLLQIILFCLICVTHGKHEHLRKSIYSHRDNVAAPILAYPDNRMCDKRCNNKYYGDSDSPYCCGRGDTTGTYYCCQYSTCCDGSYCCAPGHKCSSDGHMCTSCASKFNYSLVLILCLFVIRGWIWLGWYFCLRGCARNEGHHFYKPNSY